MKIRVWYDTPSQVFDLDPPDLEGDDLLEWIFDNVPIVQAEPIDWDFVRE